jgi:pimeloyl-ACP methyl ester carboxylesterase/DNA-binding CsgD family transcriptional regulator
MEQQIGFCTTPDGVRIAYASMGGGPPLVKAPNWLTHLEYEHQSPVWRHWWEELARDDRLIRFDQRGSGLSDWNVADISFEAWVSDLETVVEAVGVDQFALLGISQGAPVAVEYAVRHPERVSRIVLYGAYARGRLKRGASKTEFDAVVTLMKEGWGRDNPAYRQMFTSQFMPGATLEQMAWFNDLQRISTSAETAARIQAVGSGIDVLDRLPLVRAPTLVLHARGDQRVPFNEGRQIAALIPNARFVALESNNHLTLADEPAWPRLIGEVRAFLAGVEPMPAAAKLPTSAAPDGLTARELEVLRLIAGGKSNREIADALVISFNTVTNHVKSILDKTGSANRAEATSYAHRHALLDNAPR